MYDLKNNVSGENPQHIKFIYETAKPLFESWGYRVDILRAEKDYLDFFHRVIEHPRKHLEHTGKKFGFPVFGLCGIKRDLKLKPIAEYHKSIQDQVIQYVGICADEAKRLTSLRNQSGRISLLEKYGFTELMAKEKCEEYGLLSPGYQFSNRGGCWFCPNAKLEEHKEIRRLYPDTWRQFVGLENEPNVANYKYNVYGKTLHEIDDILEWDERQMTIFDFLDLKRKE